MEKSQVVGAASKGAVSARKKNGNSVAVSYGKQKYTFGSAAAAWWIINQRLPNPDRVLQKRGQAMSIYRELLSDAHLTAVLESRESATLAIPKP